MAQSDGTTVDIHLLRIGVESLDPGQWHRSEGLVDLVQANLVHGQASSLQDVLGGWNGALQHNAGVRSSKTKSQDLDSGSEAELLEAALVDDQHGRGTIANLRGGSRSNDTTLLESLELDHGLEGHIEPDTLVLVVNDLLAVLGLALEGEDLLLELALLDGLDSLDVGLVAKLVQLLLGQVVLLGEELRTSELGELHTLTPVLLDSSGFLRASVSGLETVNDAGADWHLAHRLDTHGDHYIVGSAHHSLGSKVDGLKGGTALAIHARAGHLNGELRGKHAHAANVGSLGTDLGNATADNIVNSGRRDLCAVDQLVDRSSAKIYRMPSRESTVLLSSGSADALNNICGFVES